MSAHAKLSPSGASIWFGCAGSVAAQEGLPDETTEFAAEGTNAHGISDICLSTGLEPYDFIGHRCTVEGFSFEWTEEDADYLAFGIEQMREMSKEGWFYGEHRVDLSEWLGPDQFGTLDRAIVTRGLITICDLKWGRGIPVSPIENKQLMLYALGFWENVARPLTDATDFLIIIDQPRCSGGGGEWRTTLDELLAFGEIAHTAAEATRAPDAPRTAGSHCHWCKRRTAPGGCDAHHAFMLETLGSRFEDLDDGEPLDLPTAMTPERRRFILDHSKMIENWLDTMHAQALQDALHGRPCGGLKAVEGRKSPDKWADTEAAETALLPLLGDDRFTKKVKTPTQVLKELKLKDFPDELDELVQRGKRKPVLVSEQDARPAVLMNLEQQFDDLE